MKRIWPAEAQLIELMADLPAEVSLRTMDKALGWRRSKHLDLVEELLSECGVPDVVQKLIQIMRNEPAHTWRIQYQKRTGRSERSYRRDKKLAERLKVCGQNGRVISAPMTSAT